MFFTKKYRREEKKLFSDIKNKIKKSKSIKFESLLNMEKYIIDDLEILFVLVPETIELGKNGVAFFEQSCMFTPNKIDQENNKIFRDLLKTARDTYRQQQCVLADTQKSLCIQNALSKVK